MTCVVDASVACKWFIAERGSEAPDALITGGQVLLAPDLIIPELCNVAWHKLRRGEVTEAQAASMVDSLPHVFDELVPSVHLAGRALEIAAASAHPAYDCFYVALAELRGARVMTDDRRLLTRLAETPWTGLLVRLGNDPAASC